MLRTERVGTAGMHMYILLNGGASIILYSPVGIYPIYICICMVDR